LGKDKCPLARGNNLKRLLLEEKLSNATSGVD